MSAATILAGACQTGRPTTDTTPLSSPERVSAWNAVMTASPGDLDHQFQRSVINGKIPEGLFGTRYLLNGPGRGSYGGITAHPFDGHGYVRAFSFDDDGGVRLRARFVGTPVFVEEERQKRIVFPGLGTLPDRGPKPPFQTVRNTANTTLYRWGDSILAGYEGGRPFALDAASLDTRGEHTFGGVLPDGATLAHMRIDDDNQRLVTLSPSMGRNTGLVFREFNVDGSLFSTVTSEIPGMAFIHDFVMTASHYIVAKNPLSIRILAFINAQLGRDTLLHALEGGDDNGGLVLIPRRAATQAVAQTEVVAPRIVSLTVPAFVVHFGTAFDDGDDVVVDACAFPAASFGNEFGYRAGDLPLDPGLPDARPSQRLFRFRATSTSTELSQSVLLDRGLDFPRTHPSLDGKRARVLYAATRTDRQKSDPFDAILRVDVDDAERAETEWSPGGGLFVGEPFFIPHRAAQHDDDGSVVVMMYDGNKIESTLAVFDPKSIERGPVATVRMPLLPMGFHGWADRSPA